MEENPFTDKALAPPIKTFCPAARGWLGVTLVLVALALPSPFIGWFDGLPWDRPQEMFLIAFLLPLWTILFPSSLGGRGVIFGGALLAVFKTIGLTLFPVEGLSLWIYRDEEALSQNRWEKTAGWSQDKFGSARFDRNFRETRQFPLEWINRYAEVSAVSTGNLEAMKDKISSSWRQRVLREQAGRATCGEAVRRAAHPWMDLRGWIWLGRGESLIFQTGSLRAEILELGGERATAPLIDTADPGKRIFPPVSSDGWRPLEGRWEIMDLFSVQDRNRLELSVIGKDGKSKPAFSPGRILPDGAPADPHGAEFFFGRAYSMLISGLGFFLMVATVFGQTIRPTGVKTLAWIVGLGSLAWAGPWLCGFFGFGSLAARMTWGLLPAALALWAIAGKSLSPFQGISFFRMILAVTSIGLASALFPEWRAGMHRFTWFSPGDDWAAMQNHGRTIAQGDWLNAGGEAVWAGQFGYRYVAGVLHLLFGQSWWPGQVLDLWSLAAMVATPSLILAWLGLSERSGVVAGALVLGLIGTSSAKDYLGSGLQEWVAAACLMSVAAATTWDAGNPRLRCLLWLLFVPWAIWLRLDHLPMLMAMILLLGKPTAGSWTKVVHGLREKAVRWWRPFSLFVLIVGLSVFLVCLRNFITGGVWALTDPSYVGPKLSGLSEDPLRMLKMILLGWQGSTGGPGPLALALFPAAIFGFISLAGRFGNIRNSPVEPALIFLAGLLPYAFVQEYSYAPRFCIHLVPWACLVLVLTCGKFLRFVDVPQGQGGDARPGPLAIVL